ncbi:hypothetical protein Tco_0013841, partial [Tanacetum coccineum]
VPQPSNPSENVIDKAVHKELGNSLVRAATTTFSLEAEQDSSNITKTQSKATPNESSSLGTTSGGGPKGNTLQSNEDRLKLDELMELCITLQNRALDLEKTKTTQQNEIASLKRRVKKLDKKSRSRTHKLKRLYKVGLTARVESLRDEESLGEDVSKQGRINSIDEVFVAGQNENVVKEVVDVAQVSTAVTTVTITTEEITLAQALEALKTSKPKVKGIVFQEPCKSTTTTISSQQSQDNGKGIMIEEPIKPMKKKDQISFDKETTLKLQAEFDEEERLAREKAEKEKEANIALIEEWDDIQEKIDVDHHLAKRLQAYELEELNRADTKNTKKQKVEDDKEITELKQLIKIILEEEEVATDAIPLAVKEDLEDLYKLVKAKFESTKPVEDLDLLLWGDLKTMFEPHVEDAVWRNQQAYKVLDWKLYDSCGVHSLRMQHMQIYMLVEKKYPLAPLTLSMMLENKLNIDYESEMAYQLLKLIIKQLKKIVGIKSLLDAVRITAAQVYVNTALMKLVFGSRADGYDSADVMMGMSIEELLDKIMDSGGSYHMTYMRDYLVYFKEYDGGNVVLGDGRECRV